MDPDEAICISVNLWRLFTKIFYFATTIFFVLK